ncbi:MAG TPA: Holliday junction branch migration protein RuvA [Patescibacteria group bacterium]|nr:Holliday junction branch migration protein RuvA [Patescibacteria group bacterium]
MIGSLNGVIELLDNSYVIINVNGVGYRVLLYNRLLTSFKLNDSVKLFIYTHVKEDALELFGFSSPEDLKLFQSLISVSGVGPKTAISIFSYGAGEEIIKAIVEGDVDFFTEVPRLGRKNAQKIIIELKNKMGSISELDLSGKDRSENSEIIVALKGFGFSTNEAQDALRSIKNDAKTVEEKIKLALRYLGK